MRLRTEWTANVGLVSSLAFLLIAVRILAVAHLDLTTAAAILQRGGTSSVLLGAGLTTLPVLVAAAVPGLTVLLSFGSWATATAAPARSGLIVLALVAWVFLVPQYLAAGVGVTLYLTSFLYLRLEDRVARSDERSAVEREMRMYGWEPYQSVVMQARQDAQFIDAVAGMTTSLDADLAAHVVRVETSAVEIDRLEAELTETSTTTEDPAAAADRAQRLEHHKSLMSELQREAEILEKRGAELARVSAALRAWDAKAAPLTRRHRRAVIAVISMTALVTLASSLSVPWLPTERIGRDGGSSFTAYVLDDVDDELVVLRESDRAVMVISREEHPRRALCTPKLRPWRQSLLSRILRARYSPCPSG